MRTLTHPCYLQDLPFLGMSIFWSPGFQDEDIPANMIPGQADLVFEFATEKGRSPEHTHTAVGDELCLLCEHLILQQFQKKVIPDVLLGSAH